MSSPPVFSGVRVTRSLVLYVCFVDRCLSFCTFFIWPLCCLFFFDIRFWLPPFGIFKLFLKTHLPMPVLHLHNIKRVVVDKWAIIQLYRAKNTHCILTFLTLSCIAMDVKGDYLFYFSLDQNGHARYFYHWASVVVHRLYTLTFQSSLKPQCQLESN